MSGSTIVTTTKAAERESIESHSNHVNEEESNVQKKQHRMSEDKRERTSSTMTSDSISMPNINTSSMNTTRRFNNKKDNERRDSIDISSSRHSKWSTDGDSWKTKERFFLLIIIKNGYLMIFIILVVL